MMKMRDRTLQEFTALALELNLIGAPNSWNWWLHLPQGDALFIEFQKESPHSPESISEWARKVNRLLQERGTEGSSDIDVDQLLKDLEDL